MQQNEANTMASKLRHSQQIEHVLGLKLRVDQLREQVANVE